MAPGGKRGGRLPGLGQGVGCAPRRTTGDRGLAATGPGSSDRPLGRGEGGARTGSPRHAPILGSAIHRRPDPGTLPPAPAARWRPGLGRFASSGDRRRGRTPAHGPGAGAAGRSLPLGRSHPHGDGLLGVRSDAAGRAGLSAPARCRGSGALVPPAGPWKPAETGGPRLLRAPADPGRTRRDDDRRRRLRPCSWPRSTEQPRSD